MTHPALSGRWAVSRRVPAHVILEIAHLCLSISSSLTSPADQMMQSPGSDHFLPIAIVFGYHFNLNYYYLNETPYIDIDTEIK